METNRSQVGPPPAIDRMSVIRQLVSQQFFLPPNFVIDRTNRIELEVHGSDQVFKSFSEFLYQISTPAEGEDVSSYFSVLVAASGRFNLNRNEIEGKFEQKTGGFVTEGLATEEILFITLIATILESMDLIHYKMFLKDLRLSFDEKNFQEAPKNKNQLFEKGVERLGEIADSSYSILLNLRKLIELARIFKVDIDYDQNKIDQYYSEVITSIVTNNS
jgi:hypothetical protein